jgi:hypothetical protein
MVLVLSTIVPLYESTASLLNLIAEMIFVFVVQAYYNKTFLIPIQAFFMFGRA